MIAAPKAGVASAVLSVLLVLTAVSVDAQSATAPATIGDMSIRNAVIHELTTLASAAVTAMMFSRDSQAIVCGLDDGRLATIDVADGTTQFELERHEGAVTSVSISPDGRWVASSGEDGWVYVTDLSDQSNVAAFTHQGIVHEVEFSPRGTYLISAGEMRQIRLWETDSWQERTPIAGHVGTIYALGISPDEDLILTGSGGLDDPSVRLWNLLTGEELVYDLYEGTIHDIEYSPRRRDRHAVISSTQRIMTLWDVDREAYLHLIAPYAGAINDAAYSAIGNSLAAVTDDGVFFFCTMPHWTEKRTISFDVPLLSVAFADSRQYIACSDNAGTVYLVYIP